MADMKPSRIRRVAVAGLAVLSVGGLSACSLFAGPQYRDSNGQVTATASIGPSSFQVGDCLLTVPGTGDDSSDGASPAVGKLTVVPCSSPHQGEIYAIAKNLSSDPDSLDQYCEQQFEAFDGITWDQSTLNINYFYTASQATTDVQCVAYLDAGETTEASFKGSQL